MTARIKHSVSRFLHRPLSALRLHFSLHELTHLKRKSLLTEHYTYSRIVVCYSFDGRLRTSNDIDFEIHFMNNAIFMYWTQPTTLTWIREIRVSELESRQYIRKRWSVKYGPWIESDFRCWRRCRRYGVSLKRRMNTRRSSNEWRRPIGDGLRRRPSNSKCGLELTESRLFDNQPTPSVTWRNSRTT